MSEVCDVLVVGSGNAALCAALAAQERGRRVLVIEKAGPELAGGNTAYTAGAMRFAYDNGEQLGPLLAHPDDPRLALTDFGSYPAATFANDLLGFNDGRPLSREQRILVEESYGTLRWLAEQGIRFEPIYSRQTFEKDGRHVFWGGLTLETHGEGAGLVEAEHRAFRSRGGEIRFDCAATEIMTEGGRVTGVRTRASDGTEGSIAAGAVVLASGGFESSAALRREHIGPAWDLAKVRGTPHNTGDGLAMAERLGARRHGWWGGCHATPMDYHMPDYGNLELPHLERKNYRKICYFLGVMVNARGLRFVDEGKTFRNYTYAQYGRAIMDQPGHIAWQIFDAKVETLLYGEYRFADAHYTEADTLEGLIEAIDGVDRAQLRTTLAEYNAAVNTAVPFDPTVLDGRNTPGLALPKSNWAQRLDTPPFRAYPVTGGITFTYGGLEVGEAGEVLRDDGGPIPGLFACGELVGGVFFNGYPGGSGLTSGAVFGRRAGRGAAAFSASALA